jgi:AraC-like DNA-binding protein
MKISKTEQCPKALVLTKAFCQLAQNFALSGKELSEITGMSESSISRLFQGKKTISPDTKEGEIVLLLIRIYRSLNAMLANHHDKSRAWLRSPNQYFQDCPLHEMKTLSGLMAVLHYLDAMRGKL